MHRICFNNRVVTKLDYSAHLYITILECLDTNLQCFLEAQSTVVLHIAQRGYQKELKEIKKREGVGE